MVLNLPEAASLAHGGHRATCLSQRRVKIIDQSLGKGLCTRGTPSMLSAEGQSAPAADLASAPVSLFTCYPVGVREIPFCDAEIHITA